MLLSEISHVYSGNHDSPEKHTKQTRSVTKILKLLLLNRVVHRVSLPRGIKGLSEMAKVYNFWITPYSLRLDKQLTFLQVRSDNRTQFCNV